jgi:hypothetical protein
VLAASGDDRGGDRHRQRRNDGSKPAAERYLHVKVDGGAKGESVNVQDEEQNVKIWIDSKSGAE